MVSRACKASATCIRVLISSLYCLEGTLGLTVLRYWAFFKRYFGNLNLNVRYYDITRYHLVPRYEVFLPLGWRYSVKEDLSRYYRRTDCRNMGSSDCWRVTWRVEIGQNSAFMSLSRLVGCFHIDFGAKILTISSFHSLKRALIWNNMLTVNVFGLSPLRDLIFRFKVSWESFRFKKKVHNFYSVETCLGQCCFLTSIRSAYEISANCWVVSEAQARY